MTSINKARWKDVIRLVVLRYGNGSVRWRVERRNADMGYLWTLTDKKEYESLSDAVIAADLIFKKIKQEKKTKK